MPTDNEREPPFGPVGLGERIALLDSARGFAVLAILLVNFDFGLLYFDVFPTSVFDRMIHWVVDALGRDKFWPLFALLFGIGFGIQQQRASSQGVSLFPIYLRRLITLGVIGCALLLVIDVAILLFLAIASIPLLLIGHSLRRSSPRAVFVATLLCIGVHQALSIPSDLGRDGGVSGSPDFPGVEVAARIAEFQATIESRAQAAATWNLDQLRARAGNMLSFYAALPGILWEQRGKAVWAYLQFMLAGLFLWRLGLFSDESARTGLFLRLFSICFPAGVAASAFIHRVDHNWALTQLGLGAYPSWTLRLAFSPLHTLAAFSMGLAYISGIALLLNSSTSAAVRGVFAPVGRTALTNYALQALLPALLFGSYFPGIHRETLGYSLCTGVLLLLFSLQVLFSRVWLRGFRFGPLEWLWRSLTYWQAQPMRTTRSDGHPMGHRQQGTPY